MEKFYQASGDTTLQQSVVKVSQFVSHGPSHLQAGSTNHHFDDIGPCFVWFAPLFTLFWYRSLLLDITTVKFQQLFDPLLLDSLIPLSPTTFVRIPTPQPSISLSIFCFRSVSGFLWLCDKWWGILKTSSHHHCWGDFRKIRRRWLDICPLSPLSTASHIPLGGTKLENHFEGGGNVVKWEKTWSWSSEDAQRCNCGVSVLKWGVSPATVWGSSGAVWISSIGLRHGGDMGRH